MGQISVLRLSAVRPTIVCGGDTMVLMNSITVTNAIIRSRSLINCLSVMRTVFAEFTLNTWDTLQAHQESYFGFIMTMCIIMQLLFIRTSQRFQTRANFSHGLRWYYFIRVVFCRKMFIIGDFLFSRYFTLRYVPLHLISPL